MRTRPPASRHLSPLRTQMEAYRSAADYNDWDRSVRPVLEASQREYTTAKESALQARVLKDMVALQREQTRLEREIERPGVLFGLSALDTIKKLINMACERDGPGMDLLMKVSRGWACGGVFRCWLPGCGAATMPVGVGHLCSSPPGLLPGCSAGWCSCVMRHRLRRGARVSARVKLQLRARLHVRVHVR